MRYFNLKQHHEPKDMFADERKVNISYLESTATEITKEQANEIPIWGSGNISVDENGKWEWKSCNHDTSG